MSSLLKKSTLNTLFLMIATTSFETICRAMDAVEEDIQENRGRINQSALAPTSKKRASSSDEKSIKDIERAAIYQFPSSHQLDKEAENSLVNASIKLDEKSSVNEGMELHGYPLIKTAADYYQEAKEDIQYASILSLDGGGFRGLMEAYWLEHLENKDVTNRKPHQLFNFISGTSIGGILALSASIPGAEEDRPALSTSQMVDLFVTHGHKIFPQRWKYNYPGKMFDSIWGTFRNTYDEKPLEGLLVNTFSSTPLHKALTNVIVTSATSETQEPFLFSSLHPERNHYQAWQVARATSAAPTYFRSFKVVLPQERSSQFLVDGGLWLNNPSGVAYEVALKWGQASGNIVLPDNIIMLSLGTGKMPVQYRQPEKAGLFNSVRPIIEAMMNYSSNGVNQSMEERLSKENYIRINPKLRSNIPLDCIDQKNIELLREAAEDNYEKIEEFAKDDRLRKIIEKN